MSKCKHCKAPLDGFLFKTVGKLFGLKRSEKFEDVCNKCESKELSPKNLGNQSKHSSQPFDSSEE